MKCRRVKGYLTIYLSLTLMVMLSLCLTLIDGARRSTVRLETECITDTALYSIMAEYHRELFQQYNLFYIDSSYGNEYPSFYNTQNRFQYYLGKNLQVENGTYIDLVHKDLLGLEVLDAVVTRVAFATDEDGRRFQKKAAQVVLQDAGAGLVQEVLAWVGVVESQGLAEYDVETQMQTVEEEIAEIVEKQAAEDTSLWNMDIKGPMEYVRGLISQGVLQTVLGGEKISDEYIDVTQYISSRRKRENLNRGNWTTVQVSAMERVLFHEYLLQYAGYYGQEKEEGRLKYQVEYLLGGHSSDRENLAYVASVLCAIRSAANAIYLYNDSDKMAVTATVADVLATAVLVPELAPIFQTALVLGWAYIEGLYDVKLLLAGGQVPLMKSAEQWHYDLDSILEGVDIQLKETEGKGLSYREYLHVLLYLANAEKLTFRFMDIMEMDIRKTAGNEDFRMDGCIECVEVNAVFRSRSGYKHEVNAKINYD